MYHPDGSSIFLSHEARYGRYNFHRPAEIERLAALLRSSRPKIITITGQTEEDELDLIRAACFSLGRTGYEYKDVRLDLDGYDPDHSTAEAFLIKQLSAKYDEVQQNDSKLNRALLALKKLPSPELEVTAAFCISVAVKLSTGIANLFEILTPTFEVITGPKLEPFDQLQLLIRRFTQEHGLVIYLPRSSPVPITLRRWLELLTRYHPGFALALSESEPADSIPAAPETDDRLHLTLERLQEKEFADLFNFRFGHHAISSTACNSIVAAAKGLPTRLTEVVFRLVQNDVLRGSGTALDPWHIYHNEANAQTFIQEFVSAFYEPVDVLSASPDSIARSAARFLRLSAFFADVVPVYLLGCFLHLDTDQIELIVERLKFEFGSGAEYPIVRLVEFPHADPASRYELRFLNPIAREVVLEWYSDQERDEITRSLLEFFSDNLSGNHLADAKLLFGLSQQLMDPEERGWCQNELEWWVGRAEIEELTQIVVEALRGGTLPIGVLLQIINENTPIWPPYRSLGLLEAIRLSDIDLPLEFLRPYQAIRVRVLVDVDRNDEAIAVGKHALQSCNSFESLARAYFSGIIHEACWQKGAYDQALIFAHTELEAAEALGNIDVRVAIACEHLGVTLPRTGDYDSAEAFLLRALDIHQATSSRQDRALFYLASLYAETGDYELAKPYAEQALAIRTELHGENYSGVAAVLDTLGPVCSALGENQAAREYLQKSLQIWYVLHGRNHSRTATSYNNLGCALMMQGDLAGALEALETALSIRVVLYGGNHPDIAEAHYNLAATCRAIGDTDRARKEANAALAIWGRETNSPRGLAASQFLLDLDRDLSLP